MKKALSLLNLKFALLVFGFLLCLVFFDLSNFDSEIYKRLCHLSSNWFLTNCTDYYDIRIWELLSGLSTVVALLAVWSARSQANEQLEIEQTPYVVVKERISTAGKFKLHTISLKNVGRGMARNITATSDPEGRISIIEGSNPHSIDLGSGEPNTGWAIDENRVIEGLAKQGKNIGSKTSVAGIIFDEGSVSSNEKIKSEFKLYIWYGDQIGNEYKTVVTIRRAGDFFKVVRNDVQKV